ncbi:MAG: SOS response-associated peptidase [Lachnospiraceae bacterium]|nr:SOS response-associated peptidase [Lachnospiraceae bacterium]
MCARYYLDGYLLEDIQQIVSGTDEDLYIGRREVSPTDKAPVILRHRGELYCESMIWGYKGFEGKGVIFNARSESAGEKRLFRDSLISRRCAVPAVHFYEWNKAKEKVTFSLPGSRMVFLGGLYRMEDNIPHFVILTTGANDSMRPVHDRMPLIIKKEHISDWITDSGRTEEFLQMKMPELRRSQEYEQQSLF